MVSLFVGLLIHLSSEMLGLQGSNVGISHSHAGDLECLQLVWYLVINKYIRIQRDACIHN